MMQFISLLRKKLVGHVYFSLSINWHFVLERRLVFLPRIPQIITPSSRHFLQSRHSFVITLQTIHLVLLMKLVIVSTQRKQQHIFSHQVTLYSSSLLVTWMDHPHPHLSNQLVPHIHEGQGAKSCDQQAHNIEHQENIPDLYSCYSCYSCDFFIVLHIVSSN